MGSGPNRALRPLGEVARTSFERGSGVITLCGFSVSNYYNKVKLALLEKGIPFRESLVYPYNNPEILNDSPMGKVPYIVAGDVTITESQAILEYIEDVYPAIPLYPDDPKRTAKCRELIHVIELYLELPVRRLYAEAFFGGRVAEETKREVSFALMKAVRAFAKLVRFEPFIAGPEFSYADCAAFAHLPVVSDASRRVLGADVLAAVEGIPGYLTMISARPHAQRVRSERDAGLESFAAARRRD
jgi:glutathione S-transferase